SGPLRFACECGALRGHMDEAALRHGLHIVCHCADCRAAEIHLGRPDPFPAPVDLYQTSPDFIHIDEGAAHLGLFRLGPKGLLRWHATCCGAPLFNTLASSRLPFVGVLTARLDAPERLGPVRGKGFVPQPGGKSRHEGGGAIAWGVISRMISARLSGRWRRSPFFDLETGEPVAPAQVLTREARAALYP
ncbi:DUF6151 family protein, partial [Cribrihabitans sp. XS_ASV171]